MSAGLAPDGLALIQAFVNSVELPDGEDELGSPQSAVAWLLARGVETDSIEARELQCLVEARELVRELLEGHTGENVGSEVLVRLQQVLGDAALVPVLSSAGASLTPTQPRGVDGFFANVSAAIVEASFKGTWHRLKVCRADTCRWAFYDRSKNGRGHWCSMRVCGSREKARTYRARRRIQLQPD